MQSSAVVTLRVAVMLTCLIVAPMAAIFGSSLPKVVRSLLQGKGFPRAGHDATAADLRAQGGEAPVFAASIQPPERERRPGGAAGREEAPLWPTGGSAARRQSKIQSSPPAAMSPLAGRSDAPPRPIPGATPVSLAAPASPPAGETSQVMERRLRELGATYYLLEYLGNSSQHYRFYCKMSIAGNPNDTRPFEATDSDPIQAMRRVLDQVQQWRAGATALDARPR